MESTGIANLRSSDRIHCRQPVRFQTSDDRQFPALCTDVNRNGIGIESDHILAVGQRLELLITPDDRVPMMVIYRMGHHYGLSALGCFDRVVHLLPGQ